jgi:hypothetical protein
MRKILALLTALTGGCALLLTPAAGASTTVQDSTYPEYNGTSTVTTTSNMNTDGTATVDDYGTNQFTAPAYDGGSMGVYSGRCVRRVLPHNLYADDSLMVMHADAYWDHGWIRDLLVYHDDSVMWRTGMVQFVGWTLHSSNGSQIESGSRPSPSSDETVFHFNDNTRSGLYAPKDSGRYLTVYAQYNDDYHGINVHFAWRVNLP